MSKVSRARKLSWSEQPRHQRQLPSCFASPRVFIGETATPPLDYAALFRTGDTTSRRSRLGTAPRRRRAPLVTGSSQSWSRGRAAAAPLFFRRPLPQPSPRPPPPPPPPAPTMVVHALVVMNTTGAARLTKFYTPVPPAAQQAFVRAAHALIARRPDGVTAGSLAGAAASVAGGPPLAGADEGLRLIYRQYATLFFVAAVDETESPLGILDLLQVLVETLDKCFENVCELDLIFHMDKVHYVVDEIIVGGLVMETNMADILSALQASKREMLASAGGGSGLAAGVASTFGGNYINK
ncbi:hypothetical protein I4F81_003064 [Pyropia yezoensis]|uniref:Uncharacterized protein n=1 Tax=Pyropia yezoensis TaxID=2788 RepID=A0ACC3BR48_PYRYE|nr:hypothetical protein I4F81_003064 [Neopyropia yezoensis]